MGKRKWIYPLLIILVAGGIIGYRYLFQDHRDIEKEKVAFIIKASELAKEFQADEEISRFKYQDKTIEVYGKLTSIGHSSLILDTKVFFALSENEVVPDQTKLNTTIRLKGRCLGFDSLLEEVNLDQAYLLNN